MVNCVISGNTAQRGGGGIGIPGRSASQLIDCMITNSSAGILAGGIWGSESLPRQKGDPFLCVTTVETTHVSVN